ncbi:MAG: hypothetical protein CM15mP53_05050 [Ectothiorhodospiraceae bacterium]|nr:MAG: hypothetical protein CM15mP53_05050 [Ectothiorhodospiraceae bacterium]
MRLINCPNTEFCAAVAVLTFAFVAVYMPIKPVIEELNAPTMNAMVLFNPSPIYIRKQVLERIQKVWNILFS